MARRKPEPFDLDALMNYAVRALSGHAMSTGELRTRLQRRAADASDVDKVIEKLKEAKALDDRRFAEYYATARLENQGFGKSRVLGDLRQRRVAGDLAQSVVERTFEGTDEVDLIEQFLARRYRAVELPKYLADDKHLVSAFRRLRVAGFSAAAAIRVLKRYAAQAEALEDTGEDPESSL
jgi:regulatory protein